MDMQTKVKALHAIHKNINRFIPNTHCALRKIEKIKHAFFFYGPEIMWWGRMEELADLFDQFLFAKKYTNEWNKTGFDLTTKFPYDRVI